MTFSAYWMRHIASLSRAGAVWDESHRPGIKGVREYGTWEKEVMIVTLAGPGTGHSQPYTNAPPIQYYRLTFRP